MKLSDSSLALVDWRRQVADMYRDVRARLERDPIDAHAYWRGRRDDLFRNHLQSALPVEERARFGGLRYYDYDPRYAFTATLRPPSTTRSDVGAAFAAGMQMTCIGAVDLPVGTLDVLWFDTYAGGLLLAFSDATSGNTTYGGGRYLLDTAKGADLGSRGETLVLDFNFAYQPSCAYDAKWACPLAPPANRLRVPIEAGEQLLGI
jgi:uncharacterized protein (DUF1684 family)